MPRKMKRKSAATFPSGAEVEVTPNEPGFKGAWYEATVIRAGGRYYEVRYASLVCEQDPSSPLRESVRPVHVRPRAPCLADGDSYHMHDLVDAFHNDGWWPGVVSAAEGGYPPSRYTVSFPATREVIQFAPSEMRPHRDWLHGNWLSYTHQSEAIFGEGVQVEVSGDKDNYGTIWFTGTVVKVITKDIYLVEYKIPKIDGSQEFFREFLDVQYVRPVTPSRTDVEQFVLREKIEVWLCGAWVAGVIARMVGNSRYIVKLRSSDEENLEFGHSEVRRLRIWSNGKWKCANKVGLYC